MDLKSKILGTDLTPGQIALFYLGQVGFLIKFRNRYVLIDPYLTDYVDRNCCSELVKWVRRYPSPISPDELDFIDYVFCTHAHYDHADPDTLRSVAERSPQARFYVSSPIRGTIAGYGIDASRIIGLTTDKKTEFGENMSVTAVPAAHEEIHFDASGDCLETGFLFNFGSVSVFHSGDCCPYDGLCGRIDGTDVEILPINGRDYFRTVEKDIIGCFDSTEALTVAARTRAKLLIPVHFDLYDVNCVNPAYFVDCQTKVNPAQPYHIFAPGERYIYSE